MPENPLSSLPILLISASLNALNSSVSIIGALTWVAATSCSILRASPPDWVGLCSADVSLEGARGCLWETLLWLQNTTGNDRYELYESKRQWSMISGRNRVLSTE